MEKQKLLKGLAITLTMLLIIGISCTKKESCETNNTGNIKITNNTGSAIYVSLGSGNYYYEGNRINNGSSYTFTDIDAGIVEVGGSSNNSSWTYQNSSVTACQTANFSITHLKK